MIPTFIRESTVKEEQIYLNQVMRFVKGGLMVPPANQNPITLALAPAATIPTLSAPVIYECRQGSVLEVNSLMLNVTAGAADAMDRLKVQLTDTSNLNRRFMNRPIQATHVFGNNRNAASAAQVPFRLPVKFMLEGQQTVQAEFQNWSTGGGITFSTAMEVREFQQVDMNVENVTAYLMEQRVQNLQLYPFWLTSNNDIQIGANGNVNAIFRATKDVALALYSLMFTAIVPGGGVGDLQEIAEISLFDAKTERPLQNQPFTLNTGCGTAGFPFIFPSPIIVEPNTMMRAFIQSLVTNVAIELFLTFSGVALYDPASSEFTYRVPAHTMPSATREQRYV